MSAAATVKEAAQPAIKAQSSLHFEAELVEAVVDLLRTKAAQINFEITFHPGEVRYSERGLIILPVTTDETRPTREETKLKISLEDAWNYQEPPPVRRVRLQYLWNPEISIRSTPPPLNQTV